MSSTSFFLVIFFSRPSTWTTLSVCSCRYWFHRVFRIFVARDIGPGGESDSSIPRDTPSIIAIPVYLNKTKCSGPVRSTDESVYTRIMVNAMIPKLFLPLLNVK